MKAQKGFTLVELLMAVAILAVLAGVVVPRVIEYRAQARNARCEANISNLERAVETYRFEKEGLTGITIVIIKGLTYFPQGPPDCEIPKLDDSDSAYSVTALGVISCDHGT